MRTHGSIAVLIAAGMMTLDAQRGPVDVLVIDSADGPTED
jgi:hypothetical protein